jgi:peptide/nickel transport system ATP-binding protein
VTLLQIDHLNLAILGLPILSDVRFEVNRGEVVGVIGESGSGKSMTALSIMQLLPYGTEVTGSIRLDGEDLLGKTEREMCSVRGADVGMVFQEPMTALNPVKSIGDQVAETVMIHKGASRSEALAAARETLNRVGLPEDRFPLSRYPHELSGGQRQRVVIAMAIALRPKLLIADEPTTALDVTTQAQILALLRKLVDEDGMGLVLITHDLAVVADIADRIVIMKSGEVVEAGAAVALFRSMQHPYSKALMAATSHRPVRKPPHVALDSVPVLQVSSVVREYALARRSLFAKPGAFRAVNDVSFSIHKGENVGLVGESGCGKSTLTRAILALEPTQSGEIRVGGELVTTRAGASLAARRKMQVVFQDPYGSFNPRHKVRRLISEPFHLMGRDAPAAAALDRRVAEALENVGLQARDADKYIHEFSGGQRQRVAIARALITHPSLIILDEAVSALDVSIRAQILDLLADLSDRLDLSYLFISHDLSVVRAITDRVMVMKAGQIVEAGETEAVFSNPQHDYTRQLIAATPDLEAALRRREIAAAR